MGEALSIFGRDDKGFMDIYNASRKEKYDFLYLSIEHMEARRNHDELLWSDTDGFQFDRGSAKAPIETDNSTNEINNNLDK
jgi:hypothetical protein